MDETYAVNTLKDLLSQRTLKHGLRCCAVREFGPVEQAAAGALSGLGGGWTFIFCAAEDKSMRSRRSESYLFFDDGIDADGNFERMVDIIYRRLMTHLEAQAATTYERDELVN